MGKVILVYPAVRLGRALQQEHDLPLGLLSIAAPLDRHGDTVVIIDQRVDTDWRKRLLGELSGDVVCVGISSMTGPQIKNGLAAARLVKEAGTVPVVWGGVHPTLRPEETVRHELVDLVVEGEGEETFFELVRALESGGELSAVKGLWYRDAAGIGTTGPRPFTDLNRYPLPPYHLLDVSRYFITYFGKKELACEASRGCPLKCSFCYNSKVNGNSYRELSPEHVLARVRYLVHRCGARGIHFLDDNFFLNRARGFELLKTIREENPGLQLTRVDIALGTLARFAQNEWNALRASGLRNVIVGIESGSPRMHRLLNKAVDLEALAAVNRKLRALAITPIYIFMIGLPTETKEDLRQTADLYLKLLRDNPRAVCRVHIYTPFPGTRLFDVAVQHGLSVPRRLEDWVAFSHQTLRTNLSWLSREEAGIIRMLHFTALFQDLLNGYRKAPFWVTLLAGIYAPFATLRIRHLYHRFPIERKAARLFGFYPRQG